MTSVIQIIIGIVTAYVGFVIVDSVDSGTTWNSTIAETIGGYIVPIGLLGVMGMAAFMNS